MGEFKFLDRRSIADADVRVADSGFRYGFIADIIQEPAYEQLQAGFPAVAGFKFVDKQSGGGRKRFFVGPVYNTGKDGVCTCRIHRLSSVWRDFMAECSSPEAVKLFHDHVGVPINALCHFGLAYGDEGCVQEPHVDGAVREYDDSLVKSTWATIVYFNREPGGPGATCVYDTDRKTVLFQAPSMRNGLFFFEQHPDAWHGFPVMPAGAERRILSLAYSNEPKPVYPRSDVLHRLTCKRYWKTSLGQ